MQIFKAFETQRRQLQAKVRSNSEKNDLTNLRRDQGVLAFRADVDADVEDSKRRNVSLKLTFPYIIIISKLLSELLLKSDMISNYYNL